MIASMPNSAAYVPIEVCQCRFIDAEFQHGTQQRHTERLLAVI